MARFLNGLFGAGDLERKDAADRRGTTGVAYTFGGNPYIPNWDVDRMVRDGYEKVIWVFKAIDAIADKVSSWDITCMEGRKPDWKQVDDPVLDLLNIRANRIDGAAKYFRYRLSSQLILSKKGVFIEVIPTRLGNRIAALNLLPPARTYPVPNGDGLVDQFEVQLFDGGRPRLPVYDPNKRAGVLWIRKPHPTDPYMSVTPLEAAGISIDLDFYARLYNRNFMLNDGRSGQIVSVKGGLNSDDAAELKARFSPGMGGVGRTTIIEADDLSVADTAVTPRDAQYAELRAITKEDVLIALGTAESVLGNASGRTFDNADAERESWLVDTVVPHADVVASGLEVLTAGGWMDDRYLIHDTSSEWVLGRQKRQALADARTDLEAGRITLEEWRSLAELETPDMPGARLFWTDWAGKVPTGPDADAVSAALEMHSLPQPAQEQPAGAPAPDGAPVDATSTAVDGASSAGALPPAGGTAPTGDGSGDGAAGALAPPSRALERARAMAESNQ